jgi:hypothetical protein
MLFHSLTAVTGTSPSQNPENTIEDRAVILVATAGVRLFGWKQGRQSLPLGVGQVITSHNGDIRNQPSTCYPLQIRPSVLLAN